MTEHGRAVFLSYASQDVEAAKRICDALRAAGIEVWFDQSELRGGDAWDQKIKKKIRECALFIPIISANTSSRMEGYFRLEWSLAEQRAQMIARNMPFIVPVCIDGTAETSEDVPESFVRVQWTRLPAGETQPGFAQRVSTILSPEAHIAPVPAGLRAGAISAAPASRSKLLPLLVAALGLIGLGYFALDRLVLSNHTDRAAPALATASLTVEPAPRTTNEKSIAVLPFIDLSEKKDQEYFSDGLAEELLDLLAKTPGLHVIARTSSFSFKGRSDDIPTIGRKLNVANILEGSVRKSGKRLRVTTQLIRAGSGEHLWSETYDRELKDVFAVQDEIAAAVVAQLKVRLVAAPLGSARSTSNPEAYDEYLLGQQFYRGGNLNSWKRASEAYHRAIALDPDYLAPYEGLTLAEYQIAGHSPGVAHYELALAAAAHAVELGPDDPSAYGARGFVRYNITWDWAGAQADFAKATELDPGNTGFQLGQADVLGTLGRLPEAIAATRKVIEFDPLNASSWTRLPWYLAFMGDFAGAEEASRRALEIGPDSVFALNDRGCLQLKSGNAQVALETFRKIDEEAFRLYGTAMAEHTLTDPQESQRALDELIAKYAGDAAYQIAEVYAWRGESDKAFEWLERAYTQRDGGLTLITYDPLLDSLRSDVRYKAFLRKMKLPV